MDEKLDEFHAGRAGEDTEGDYTATSAMPPSDWNTARIRDRARPVKKAPARKRPRRSGAVAQGVRGKRAFRSRTIRDAEDSSHKGVHQRAKRNRTSDTAL